MPRRALVVDPSVYRLESLRRAVGGVIDLTTCTDFVRAREQLLKTPPDLFASHVRLGPYNGLHLVHLAVSAGLPTRSIVYDERPDFGLISEARALGAFYETAFRLPLALASYLNADLPSRDRRDAVRADRRTLFRGGRRSADVATDTPGGSAALLH